MLKKALIMSLITWLGLGCSKIDKRMPEINAVSLDGKAINAQALKNKVVVVNVWASWCGDCIAEIPKLNALAERYAQDSTVIFLAISNDPEEKVRYLLEKRPFAYTHIADAEALTNQFHTGLVKSIPKSFVIGKDGIIRCQLDGNKPTIVELLTAEIEQAKQ